jgi:hypothetical protein
MLARRVDHGKLKIAIKGRGCDWLPHLGIKRTG